MKSRLWQAFAVAACVTALCRPVPARAEASEVRFSQEYGLSYLGLLIMKHDQLVEKHLASRGVTGVKVTWARLGGPSAMMEAVLSGQVDYIAPGAPTLATMWDKTVGTPGEIRALCALNSMPEILLSRNPATRTIRDFTDRDRIALPAVKVTAQAIVLEMAAAATWGKGEWERLDPLTVTLAHPEAVVAMLGGKSEITGHFTIPPFYQLELRNPSIHKVLSSYDVLGGKHTNGMLLTTKRFYEANPTINAAVSDAIDEANAFIGEHPHEAAALYVSESGDRLISVADVETMLRDPDIEFTRTPAGIMKFVNFMHDVGRLRHLPAAWTDLFFPLSPNSQRLLSGSPCRELPRPVRMPSAAFAHRVRLWTAASRTSPEVRLTCRIHPAEATVVGGQLATAMRRDERPQRQGADCRLARHVGSRDRPGQRGSAAVKSCASGRFNPMRSRGCGAVARRAARQMAIPAAMGARVQVRSSRDARCRPIDSQEGQA